MEEAERTAWNAQRGFWLDKQDAAKMELKYWNLKYIQTGLEIEAMKDKQVKG